MSAYCPKGHPIDPKAGSCPTCDGSRAAPRTVFEGDFDSAPAPQRGNFQPTVPPTVGPPFLGRGFPPAAPPPPWQAPQNLGGGRPNVGHAPVGATRFDEDEPERLMGFLVIRDPSQAEEYTYVRLRKGVNSIGRFGSRAAVELRDNQASESHALIICTNQAARLVDLDSSNGTWVARQRTEYKQLEEGDRIVIGRTEMVYVPFPWVAG